MAFFDDNSPFNKWVKQGETLLTHTKSMVYKHTARRTLADVITTLPDTDKPIIEIVPQRQSKKRLADQLTLAPIQKKPVALPNQAQGHKRPKINLNQLLKVTTVSLGLSLGGLVYPVLGVMGGLGLTYSVLGVFTMTYKQLRQGMVTVDVLVSGTMLGCIMSGNFLIGNTAGLVFLGSLWMVNKVKAETKQHLADVFGKAPQFVWILVDDTEVTIPFSQLEAGHIAIVETGETIPADGVVTDGMATIDQHILTGEARPVERGVGEQVFASTVVLSGKIFIKVEKAGQETTVAQIGKILSQTTDFKSKTVLRAESLANQTVIPTLLLTAISFPLIGTMGALAIFNAHFKRKLTLITPISILNYFSIASKQGILIKDGRSLDLLHQVDTIVFDKTGTLTEEQPHVGQIHICADYDENTVLQLATAAEYKQTHPIAQAIIQEAEKRGLDIPDIAESEYKIGYGLTVSVEDKTIRVGSNRFMETMDIILPDSIVTAQTTCYEQGYSLVMVAVNDKLVGAIELWPTIRPEAQAVIEQLKQHPRIKETYIISGDNETPTHKLAQQLGIDHYFAETLPEEKAELIDQLQQQGKFVCYIGDGINDAIALKKAQVSISLKGASTIATDTAQIILLDEGLQHLNFLFDLAEDFQRNTNINFGIVVLPSLIGVGGVYLFGLGLVSTFPIVVGSIGLGIGNAMLPRLKYRRLMTSPSKN